jgi:hypothetical protein
VPERAEAKISTAVLQPTGAGLLVGQTQLRNHNGWKAAGILALLAVFLCVMLVVPSLRRAPEPGTVTQEPGVSP